eukprot:5429554-Ditylum_brightwellii.AAC.1
MQQVALLGSIIEIHPTLVRKEALAEDLHNQLSVLKSKGNRVADDWKKKYRPEWMKETTPVLHFTVSTGARKFGNDANKVETMVIHIESAEISPSAWGREL